jgi:hypothetical protein
MNCCCPSTTLIAGGGDFPACSISLPRRLRRNTLKHRRSQKCQSTTISEKRHNEMVQFSQDDLKLLARETKAMAYLALVLSDGTPQVTPIWF